MLDLTKFTVEHITKQFVAAQIENTGALTPRNGFYHVVGFEFRDVNNKFTQIPIIKAHWKVNRYDTFLKDVVFEIALSSLEPANSNERFDYSNIIGKTFQVFNMSLSFFPGYPNGRVQGKWLYEIVPHEVMSRAAMALSAMSIITTPDGIIKVEGDEGVDYEEEANRMDDSTSFESYPDNYNDWDGFDENEPVEV